MILALHAVTGLPSALRPLLFVFGLLVGLLLFYGLRQRLDRLLGSERLSGAQFVSWYFVIRIASVLLMLPVIFALGLSTPLAAFVLGFVSAAIFSFWTKLFLATPFFGEDAALRAQVRNLGDAALVAGGVAIGFYLLALAVYVLIEYVLGPVIRYLA